MMKKKLFYIEYLIIILLLSLFLPYILLPLGFKIRVVLSDSMKHEKKVSENFYVAWEKSGYNKSEVNKFTLPEGFEMSDVLIEKIKEKYEIGDVVVFKDDGTTFMHRLVAYNTTHFLPLSDGEIIDSKKIYYEIGWKPISTIEGKIIGRIPKIGFTWILLRCLVEESCNTGDCLFFNMCKIHLKKEIQ